MTEGTTAGVGARAGQELAGVPKVQVVGSEPPAVACVVLPKVGWSGAQVGDWAGAGAACLPPLEPGMVPDMRLYIGGMVVMGLSSASGAGWGARAAHGLGEVPALTAGHPDRLVEGGVLGTLTGAALAAGRREEHQGSGAPQPEMASVSPHRPPVRRRSTAFFSASRSSALTWKPSSGAGGSLRGGPRLCGSKGTLRFRGLGLSGVGERFLRDPCCPLVPCGSFPCWLLLRRSGKAEEGA